MTEVPHEGEILYEMPSYPAPAAIGREMFQSRSSAALPACEMCMQKIRVRQMQCLEFFLHCASHPPSLFLL